VALFDGRHASEEALLSLLEGERPGTERLRRHLQRCDVCQDRLAELRRVRVLLREAADYEAAPERDLAFGAMRRLHRRHSAIANVNEFFGALFAIVRGLRTLLAADDAPPADARPSAKSPRGESLHG